MTTIGYVRVSGSKQVAEGFGLTTQERRIRAYAQSQDWPLLEIVRDEGESGAASNRPGFLRLRALAEDGQLTRIIVFKLDRLSRSLLDLKQFVDRIMLPNNVALVSVTEQLDTSSSSGKLFFNILGSFAEFERDLITERLKAARESKVLRGGKGAGRVYGYKWEGRGRDRILVPHSSEFENVRWIFEQYAKSQCLKTLTERVQAHGIVTRAGKPFARSTLRYMLSNPFYAGVVQHGGHRLTGQHRAAVTLEAYKKVSDALDRLPTRKRNSAVHKVLR